MHWDGYLFVKFCPILFFYIKHRFFLAAENLDFRFHYFFLHSHCFFFLVVFLLGDEDMVILGDGQMEWCKGTTP